MERRNGEEGGKGGVEMKEEVKETEERQRKVTLKNNFGSPRQIRAG